MLSVIIGWDLAVDVSGKPNDQASSSLWTLSALINVWVWWRVFWALNPQLVMVASNEIVLLEHAVLDRLTVAEFGRSPTRNLNKDSSCESERLLACPYIFPSSSEKRISALLIA